MLLANYPVSFDAFRRQVDGFFNDTLREFAARPYPALNVWENGDGVTIEAELPGLTMADIEVLVEGQELTIRGQRNAPPPDGVTAHRLERAVGTFLRKLTLPTDLDADRIEATLKDGVLTIRLPRSERAKPRRIEVKSAS